MSAKETPIRVVRGAEARARLGISKATYYRRVRAGLLPPRRRIGPNSIGFLSDEFDAFLRQLPIVDRPDNSNEQSED